MDEQWKQEMEDVSVAITSSVGALCLSVSMVVYLAPLNTHEQMEAINSQLVPLLDERGVQLCWKRVNSLVDVMKQVSQGTQLHIPSPGGEEVTRKVDDHTGELQVSPAQSSATTTSKTSKDCSKQALSSSYASCCACLQYLLVEEQFLDEWLTSNSTCPSLAYLMPCSLVHSVWNRWPLVCDPHGFASKWIKGYVGQELVCLDGRDRYIVYIYLYICTHERL